MRPLLCLVVLLKFTKVSSETGFQRKNVLLVLLDDFRPAINALGDSRAVTPNLDRLVSSSYVFRNTFAQQALCAPSRNSLLTGRRPDVLKLYDFDSYWRDSAGNFTTLPQYFKENGYFTYSVGKVFHPGKSSNFSDDFPYSWSEPPFHAKSEKYLNDAVCLKANGNFAKNLLCPVDLHIFPGHSLPDIDSMLHAKDILAKRNLDSRPFFLAVGFHKPHIPFQFPAKYLLFHQDLSKFKSPDDTFKPYGLPDVAWNPFNDLRKRDDVRSLNLSFPFETLPRDFRLLARQHYYASVTYIDDLVGELLKSVDLKKTVVVLTSDHGWSLGEHTAWAKYSNFEVAVKVPLVIFDGGRHEVVDGVHELLDLFPTLAELAGLPSVRNCQTAKEELCSQGRSLVPMMKGSKEETTALSQYPRPGLEPTKHPDSDKPKLKQIRVMGYSLRTTQFRYTAWAKFNPERLETDWDTIYAEELYDHSFDDGEYMNLADRDELKETKDLLFQQLQAKAQNI